MAGHARVFISYSSKDADLVDRLKSALAQAGVDVWLDHEQLAPGTPDWRAAVLRGIEQATTVIYAASPEAASSKYVGHELAIAEGEGKTILPFWICGEKWYFCAPMGFYFTQHIDGRDAAYTSGLAKLLATLGVASAAPAAPSIPRIPLHFRRCNTQIRRTQGRCFVEVVAYRDNNSFSHSDGQIVYSREFAQNNSQDRRLDDIGALDAVRKELEQNRWERIRFVADYPDYFYVGIWRRDDFERR